MLFRPVKAPALRKNERGETAVCECEICLRDPAALKAQSSIEAARAKAKKPPAVVSYLGTVEREDNGAPIAAFIAFTEPRETYLIPIEVHPHEIAKAADAGPDPHEGVN